MTHILKLVKEAKQHGCIKEECRLKKNTLVTYNIQRFTPCPCHHGGYQYEYLLFVDSFQIRMDFYGMRLYMNFEIKLLLYYKYLQFNLKLPKLLHRFDQDPRLCHRL